MADRNRELVPGNWSLVRERALTTGLCSKDGILNARVSVGAAGKECKGEEVLNGRWEPDEK